MIRSLRLALLVLVSSVAVATAAELAKIEPPDAVDRSDWPQWRGPHRDGISPDTGLKHEWPEKGPPLAWSSKGLGGGFASVSMADGKIYTMGDRGEEQFVMALSAADGKKLWETKISVPWRDRQNYLGPRCTPTLDGRRAYVVGTYGDVVCLDTDSGSIVWQKNFEKDFGGKMMSGWGYSESPLVDGDKLLCTPGAKDAAIVALDKKTGATIWKTAMPELGPNGKDGAAYSSIVVSEAGGLRQYVQLMGRGVIGVRASDGKYLWGYNKIANPTANIPTPIIHGDYVFCSTGYRAGAALLKINRTMPGADIEEVWFLDAKVLQNHHGGMVLVGDYLYGGNGHNNGFPICVEFLTGKVMWSAGRGPGSGSAAVVYADGYLYFRYQNGILAQIEATPKEYRLKGQFEIPAPDDNKKPSWPHPVVTGGKLYLREQDALYCYDLRK